VGYVPPIVHAPGVVLWSWYYVYNVVIPGNPKIIVDNHFGLKIQTANSHLLINVNQGDPWSGVQAHSRHSILRTDMGGNVPDVHVNNYNPLLGWVASNNSSFFALTDDHVYLTENPASAPYDPTNPGALSPVNTLFSDYTSMNTNTLNYAKYFNPTGNQTILDMFTDASNIIYMAGAAAGDPVNSFGENDIYLITANASTMSDTNNTVSCAEVDTPNMNAPVVTIFPSDHWIQDTNVVVAVTVDSTDPNLSVKTVCGACFNKADLNITSNAGCNFTATVTAATGNVIAGYKWVIPSPGGPITIIHPTSSTTDNVSFSLTPGTIGVVKVTIFSVNMKNVDHACCDTTLIDTVSCNQPCSINAASITVTALASDSLRNCCFSVSATATPAPGYAITGYSWTYPPLLPSYPGTASGTPVNFCIPSVTPQTPGNLQVVITASDAAGHTCNLTLSDSIGCLQGIPLHKGGHTTKTGGVADGIVNGNLVIYPNPTTGIITITSSGEPINVVQVFDITGKLLSETTFDKLNKVNVSIAAYTPGSYVIKVNSKKVQVINKIE
jgi:hypothetical protein